MPVRRSRRRYLAIYIEGARPSGPGELEELIFSSLLRLFGEVGASKALFKVIDYDGEEGLAIIRCGHEHMGLLRAALAAITDVRGSPTALHVIDVSGTSKALRKRLPSRLADLRFIRHERSRGAGMR